MWAALVADSMQGSVEVIQDTLELLRAISVVVQIISHETARLRP